jgi:hypothetical protein
VLDASTDHEFESVFAGAARLGAAGLVISSDSFFFAHIEKLAALASRHKLPAIFGFREYPKAGGLMSYGADLNDQLRTVGAYVGRILNGEKPGDLPVICPRSVGRQSQGCEATGPYNAFLVAAPRRRDNRMISANVGLWPDADLPVALPNVCS